MNQDGVVPPQGGPARRPAGGPHPGPPPGPGHRARHAYGQAGPAGPRRPGAAFGPGDLGDALRSSVAGVGLAGPPPDGLARVRRKARARQRSRAVAAGGTTVLVLACALAVAAGGQLRLPAALTGRHDAVVSGVATGPAGALPGQTPGAAGYGGQAVPDWPGVPGRLMATGPAIGPVAPLTATPTAAAAADLPLCSASSLITSTTLGPIVGPGVYGHVDAVAQAACVAVGPPVVTVANQAGTAAASVGIFREDTLDAPLLPEVPTWGRTLVLRPGQGYEFQFAWIPVTCARPTGSAAAAGAPASPAAAQATYSFGYAVQGTTPSAVVSLTAACTVDLYVTDIYPTGAYPVPQPAAAASATAPTGSPTGTASTGSGSGSAPTGGASGAASPAGPPSQSPVATPDTDPGTAAGAGAPPS